MQLALGANILDNFFEFNVDFTGWVKSGEEIRKQTIEYIQIGGCNLRNIEISESSHKDSLFGELWFCSFKASCHDKHRFNGSKSPIVMQLLGEQISAEEVEGDEFLS